MAVVLPGRRGQGAAADAGDEEETGPGVPRGDLREDSPAGTRFHRPVQGSVSGRNRYPALRDDALVCVVALRESYYGIKALARDSKDGNDLATAASASSNDCRTNEGGRGGLGRVGATYAYLLFEEILG